MIEKKLLDILCCPETRQAVSLASDELIAKINEEIAAGTISNRAEKTVRVSLDAGLIREDGKVLYPIREGIPIMLIEEGIYIDA